MSEFRSSEMRRDGQPETALSEGLSSESTLESTAQAGVGSSGIRSGDEACAAVVHITTTRHSLPRASLPRSYSVVRSVVWATGAQLGAQALGFLKLAVVARYLGPINYGHIAVANLVIGAATALSQTGTRAYLIQARSADDRSIHYCWTLECGKAAIVGLLVYAAASPIAAALNARGSLGFIRIAGLSLALAGTPSLFQVRFDKQGNLGPTSRLLLCGAVIDVVVISGAAVIVGSAEAVLAGMIAAQAAKVVVSFLQVGTPPRLCFSAHIGREVLVFAAWSFTASLMAYIAQQSDQLLLANRLGASRLAEYQLASILASLPMLLFAGAISSVVFPLLARHNDKRWAFHKRFRTCLAVVMAVLAPIAIYLSLSIDNIIVLVFGAKWRAAGMPAILLVLASSARPLLSLVETGALADRRPRKAALVQMVRVGVVLCAVPVFFRMSSTVEVATLMTVVMACSLAICVMLVPRNVRRLDRANRNVLLVVGSASSAMCVVGAVFRVFGATGAGGLVVQAIVSGAVYVATLLWAVSCLSDKRTFVFLRPLGNVIAQYWVQPCRRKHVHR